MLHSKLTKLLNLTRSENDPEALSAIRMANSLISKNGLTWNAIILNDTPPTPRSIESEYPDIQDMIDAIRGSVSEDFDFTFLDSVERQYKRRGKLSDNQISALQNIYDNWIDN
jgi:hypothetical protein